MTLEEKFADAQQRVKTLSKSPDNATLLQLYACYKQGCKGDVTGKRPGMLDIRGRAKYDAWAAQKGTSKQDAMEKYVGIVDRLVG